MIIKPLGEEISVTTEDDINGAKLIRIYAAAASKVTIENPDANTVIGSFTVPAGSTTIVEKSATDTIAGTTTLLCTPVAYKS
jgi:UDP-glucose 6-dehydrogenase